MRILVSGGLGFIGSHTVVELLNHKHEVVIIDNLYNSQISTLHKIERISGKKPAFYELDATDYEALENVFQSYDFDGIIHFAGYKAVGESVRKPLEYYYNNLVSTINLAKLAVINQVPKFIFSSSATVYGDGTSPFNESMPLLERTNPYGETKAMSERILTDAAKANPGLNVVLLRYFNPIGAHPSGLIGEVPNGIPNNLMPYVTQVAKGLREKLNVFGNDYDTIDGTGVRDYIHVVDLAQGHVAALEANISGVEAVNLGTGKGTSVLEIIQAFEQENNIKIPYEIVSRRPGDIAVSYADTTKAKNLLQWEAKLNIKDMVRDAWHFESNLK
ncbi:UDP-glucose 4-epimerase GalE [Paracholeplasma manati]|uniref:UDP-glucose 4-epimerase GalE n=1 Tax=Paracholeplasma manati TaxID=591373 RepID=UPI002407C32D|nr:UDP-glucose 4-epimerase GalE [Paracholeplasma manati]MDG0889009.1 UDP-glucose 4-epimerase GalE [Paracholeplasma manati]